VAAPTIRARFYDAILIKENHATLAGGVGEAVRRARK
jgi:nicotinate-nucleotide pyrophosphorylase